MGSSGGGKGGGGSAPKAPNYVAVAKEQGAQNRQSAYENTVANRPTQYDVWGNKLSWTQSDSPELAQKKQQLAEYQKIRDSGKGGHQKWWQKNRIDPLQKEIDSLAGGTEWTQNVTLDPQIQSMYDQYLGDTQAAQQGYGQRLQDVLGMLQNKFQAPGMPQGVDVQSLLPQLGQAPDLMGQLGRAPTAPDVSALLSQLNLPSAPQINMPTYDANSGREVSDALYGSVMDRARTEQQRETDALSGQLRMQGLVPGTEAYNRAMQNLTTSHGDVQTLAAQNATLAGYDEARQRYLAQLSGVDRQLAQHQAGLDTYGAGLSGIDRQLAGYGAQLQGYGTDINTLLAQRGMDLDTYGAGLSGIDRLLQQYQMDLGAQSQEFGQRLTERTQPLEELSFLAQLGQPINPSFQGFSSATGYSPGDLLGASQAQYNAQLGGYNSGVAQKGNLLGAGATLGGSYLGSKL